MPIRRAVSDSGMPCGWELTNVDIGRGDLLACAVRGSFPRRPCARAAPSSPDASMTITPEMGSAAYRIEGAHMMMGYGPAVDCRQQARLGCNNVRGGKALWWKGDGGCV